MTATTIYCDDACDTKSRPDNGNCVDRDPTDDLPVQCVGEWVQEKHDLLKNYIEATWAARMRFLHPPSGIPPGGAAFIDLFAGPGRSRVRSNGKVVDGSPLVALKHARVPFTKVVLCELDPESAAALQVRTAPYGDRVVVIPGDCHTNVDRIIAAIPPRGLNLAFIDPFSLDHLSYGTLVRLAQVERMDMLINFSTGGLKRTIGPGTNARLERAIGAHRPVLKAGQITSAIGDLRARLREFGYTGARVRSVEIKNSKNVVLYHLIYASKKPLGDEIWQSVVRCGRPQRELF